DAVIVSDEVYEHLTFNEPHAPIATLPGAEMRTVTISSGGKTFNTTGWKIGWVTAPHELVQAITAVKQYLTFVNGAPFQPAIAVGLGLPDSYFRDLAQGLKERCALLTRGLQRAGLTVSRPDGGYFVIADAAPLGFDNADTAALALPELAGVVGIPLTAFVHEHHREPFATKLRFAFCKKTHVLERAASRASGHGRVAHLGTVHQSAAKIARPARRADRDNAPALDGDPAEWYAQSRLEHHNLPDPTDPTKPLWTHQRTQRTARYWHR